MPRRYNDNPLMNKHRGHGAGRGERDGQNRGNGSGDQYGGHGYREEPEGPNWKKVLLISLVSVLLVVAAGGGVIWYVGHDLISLSNYVADEDVKTIDDMPEAMRETESAEELLNEEQLNLVREQLDSAQEIQTVTDDNVFNLLLVGVDRTDKSWNGNSDSMMLVSINDAAKRVSVVSLMRDTYVDIPGYGYHKLNNAYAVGGGPLLTQTVTDTYKVDVTRYAAVDFENMVEIVDALGGIDLEMTDAEVEVMNGYILDMCDRVLHLNGYDYLLPGGGVFHVNGVQAVAYARNRFVGNSDYARTERQRYVISQMIAEIRRMDVAQMYQFVRDVLPLVKHNVEESEIWDMVTKAPEILQYEFVQDRIPYDGMYDTMDVKGEDMLVPHWADTIEKLHDTIYKGGEVSQNTDNTADRLKTNDEIAADYPGLEDTPAAAQTEAPASNAKSDSNTKKNKNTSTDTNVNKNTGSSQSAPENDDGSSSGGDAQSDIPKGSIGDGVIIIH